MLQHMLDFKAEEGWEIKAEVHWKHYLTVVVPGDITKDKKSTAWVQVSILF